MHIPAEIEIRNRKVMKGYGGLGGIPINAPAGMYEVLAIADDREKRDQLPELAKDRPFARILTIAPGLLALIDPKDEEA